MLRIPPPSPYDTLFDPHYKGEPVSTPPPFNGLEPFEKAEPLPPEEYRNMVARYDGEIRFCDAWVGNLFEGLKRMGMFDKSLILLTADHGEEFYEHGGWDHGQSLYEELIHIPLILKLPYGKEKGTVVENLVRHVDIAPTILDCMGVPRSDDMAGINLLSLLSDQDKGNPPLVSFSEVDRGGGRMAKAIRTQRNKFIRANLSGKRKDEFFDLSNDPGEKTNILEQHPDLARELSEELDVLSHYAASKEKQDATTVEMDPSIGQRLKALGYIQ